MISRKLQDLPSQSLPREKLIRQGRHSLSNAELLAIFIRMGIKGKNVLDMSSDLIQAAGSLDALAHMEATEITEICKGIGMAKLPPYAPPLTWGQSPARDSGKTSPQHAGGHLRLPDHGHALERQGDSARPSSGRPVPPHQARGNFTGTLNESIAHPRDILRPAIIHNAYGFILAHNHPSGNPAPSQADDTLTGRIRESAKLLGVRFLDHIIIGKPTATVQRNYYSYNSYGMKKPV